MITNQKEYAWAIQKVKIETKNLELTRAELKSLGLSDAQIKQATDPLESFALKLKEEIVQYEQLYPSKVKPEAK